MHLGWVRYFFVHSSSYYTSCFNFEIDSTHLCVLFADSDKSNPKNEIKQFLFEKRH